MESTPKSTQARYISHGCQKHSKLRLRPLQFVQDYKSGPHSIHSNTSLTSLFEESSLCSSLGEVDTSWFDNERWTSNEETKWKREEDILKTPQASQRESKVGSTPGLFTPDGLSPVARRQKDYTECHPPPDEDAMSSFAQPKRFRKVPSSIHTTPNSQIITSHQPASGPTAETIEEEDEGDDVAEFHDQPVEIQFSPFPTWNPTHQKDTPIFMKQLFKTPSTLFGAGDKRACSTPLQRLSTPQRLSRSLGAEPEESDFSWTSSLATPPMSSKGSKTGTSSTKKGNEDDSWQTHVVAKVLFKDGGSVVEVDSCEEGDEGSTQPLQVIKLPSITDESQEEEFTMETEDGGESDKSVADRSKAISVPGNKQCDSSDVSNGIKLTDNLKNDQVANCTVSNESLVPPSTSVQSTWTDHGKPHLAKQERHDSVNEYSHLNKAPHQYFKEKSSVREKDEAVTNVELGMNSAAELKSRINLSRGCTDTNASSKLVFETHGSIRRHPSIQSAMSSQEPPIIGSNYASQTLFNSQESTKNEKTAIEETLAFLLATPPSRREKLLDSLCATGVSMVESTPIEQADGDAAGSALEVKCDVPFTSNDLMKGVSDDSLMSPPPGLFRIPTTSGHTSGELDGNPMDSDCSVDVKTNVRLVETPNRPAPDVDLLSPISPNFAEALCRVTDNASKAQFDGSNSTLTLQKCLGVEKNLIGDFDNPDSDTAKSQVTVLDYLRSGDHTDILVEKDLHPVGTIEQNAIAEHLSTPITSSLPSSANKQLPKHLMSKQEIRSVMPSAMSSSTSNLNTQIITKGRFTYTAPMARKNEASASKTPSWLTRAVYVEEDEKKEETSDTTQAETKDVSLKKPWTMGRPCRTGTSFTTFSTFCKTAPNPPTRIMSSTQSQKGLRTSTTPTSRRSVIQSAPPHNKTLVRIREIPHSWPSPKRLRLEEEIDERPAENGLEDASAAVNEHEIGFVESRGSPVGDAKSRPVQDLDKITTDQNSLGDFRDIVNSKDHVSSSEGGLHQTRSQRQDTANQIAPNGGFSSASGKAIFVSSEALEKAERLLEDVDREKPPEEFQLNLSTVDKQCGFQSASGKSIAISEAALSKAKKIIAEVSTHEEETHVPNITQPTSLGFTSARGSVIKVSEAAMAKARKMMNDINQDEETDTALHEETVKQTSHIPVVGGGGDRSRIHSGEVEHTMTLPGNALPQRRTDNRQRHKGFRPFKPPCLVVKVQKPSNSPPSISSINTNIAIDVIKESEREGRLETCRISVPDDLRASIKHRNVVVPEPQQHDRKNFEASNSSLGLERNEDRQKLIDNLNRQPIDDSELDISEDDCLSASQAAREIKAAEEMELVYNFMQEEDAGFSQLDVSSVLAADRIEKRAAQVLKYTDTPKDSVQKKEGHTSIYHEQEPVHHHAGAPIGAVGEPTNGNKETLANNLEKESQLDVAFVQSHLLTRSCESEDETILPSLKCARKETLDRHSLKPAGQDHAHEIDASNREVLIADLSLNTVRQLMDDSSILIDEPQAVGSDFGEEKVQKEMFSHIDNYILRHSKADARKLLKTSQESTTVTEIKCTDEPKAHGKSDPKKKWNPNSSTETSKLDGDSSQEQLKQEKMLRDEPGSRTDNNNSEAYSPVGFKTAGGKKIQVSDSALQKASFLLSECNSDVERIMECNTEISGEFLNQHVPTSSVHDICRSDDMHPEENMECCKSDDQKHTKDLVSIGFQTARGNKVHVSRSALQKARKMHEVDIEDNFDCAPGGSPMLTPNTYDSEKLPNTTCDMDKDLTIVELEQVPQKSSLTSTGLFSKTVGFQTSSGNVVTVSCDSLSRAKQLFAECDAESAISPSLESGLRAGNLPKAVGFQTASGSKITVSDDALQKARKLLSNEMESSNEDAIEKAARDSLPEEISSLVEFQTASGNFIEISEASLLKAGQLLASDTNSCNARDIHSNLPDNLGSVTAAGGIANMNSEVPLPKARQVRTRHEDPCDDSSGQRGSFDTENLAPRQIGFQTVGGGVISVSDDSLRKAKRLLGGDAPDENIQEREEMKQTVAESTPPMIGFQTGRGKHIHISESAMQVAKQLLSTDFNGKEGLMSPDVEGSTALSNKHPGPVQLEVGLQTGGGKKIEVSESSVLKARHLFSDEIDSNQNVLNSEPSGPRKKDDSKPADMESTRTIGFQTGSGKKIKISAESLQHARSLLGSEYEEADKVARSPKSQELRNENVMVGFQTGHGTKVQISEASLQKAKHFLADETNALPYESTAVGFQTGHGKKVQISEASLQKAKQFLADETDELPHEITAVGFQTGHGKKVQISEASLQKAKRFLADETDALPHESIAVGFQTGHGKKVQISEASLQKAKHFLADETNALLHESIAVGFQTGHGKKVQISKASLQKAKRLLADETDELPHESTAVGFQTGHGKKVQISEASLQKAKRFLADETDALPHESIAVGFQTGHGKKVQISEASLQKAKRFLADETDALPHENTAVGFQTAHGKKVHISEESITKAKQFLAEGNDTLPEPLRPDQKRAVGFQTVQGENVQISEASLQRAKQFLADGNDTGTEGTSKDSAVPAEAKERPLSGKPSEMAGFMTGDGRKVQVSEASLQQARNMLDAKAKNDPISKEHSRKQLNGGQQQTLVSIAVDDNVPCQRKDLKKEEHFGQERIRVSVGGDRSLEMPSNLPQRRSEAGGLKRRGSMDMRNRTSNQQKNMSRGSRGTGQKPYKPPRRVSDKGSPSDRGLIPRCAHPTAVLSDRTKQLKALQSSPPTRQSTSLCVSDGSIHRAGPFVKPHQDQDPTNQSQSQSEATPTPEDACSFVARWAEARRAQQQRIDAKRNKVIKPDLGSLWRSRKQQDRISLRDFVDHQHPCSMSDSELFGHGILSSTLSVRPSNAGEYEFAGEDHFSPSCLESNQGIPLADGGKLVLSPNGLAGKKEFYSALLDTPGVDPKLLKEEWAFNHYKWIIWKAAAMEVAYPLQLGGRFLTPNWVLLQLKYRYDREIDHSQRPALRKILERDDAASRRMVLCVSAIESTGSSAGQDGKGREQRKNLATIAHPTLELTDGWYSIPAAIDPPLANYVRSGKIVCGTKLCIYGAELVGSQDACSPLEIPEGLKLKITANSTRRARYDARLGLQADPRPFPLPTTSLHPDGGTVGCMDVLILRTYPMQFMEKLPEGGSVFRNAKEEAKAAALHASQKHNKMEQLFTQIQKQFEAKQASKGQGGKMKRSLSSSRGRRDAMDIEKLQSGEELFEAMEAAIDPAAFESVLSEHQQTALHAYQRSQNEMKQADMQAAFNRALAKQNKEGKFERTVVPLLKVRVADYKASTTKGQQTTFLTIWQPTDDLVTQLVEGKRFRISSLSTSTGRNVPGMAPVQLASTRATRYEELPAASHILQKSYIPRAAASMQWLGRGYTQAAYGELDVVGVVVSSEEPKHQPGSSQCHAVYLADQDAATMAIKFWTSPMALNLDDMLKPGSFISMNNLQYRSAFSTPSAVALPTATASDNTTFTPNPKAGYLQAALNQLKAGIKDVPKFVEMMQRRVQSLKDAPSQLTYPGSTPRNHPFAARRDWVTTPLAGMSWARSGIQSSPPTSVTPQGQQYQLMTVRSCPKNFLKTSYPSNVTSKDGTLNPRVVQVAGSTPPHIHPGGTREPTTPTVRTPCQSPMSVLSEVGVSPRLMAQHIEQERRSQLLSRIPSPPPLTPLPYPAATSALKRGFKIPSPLVRGSQKADPEKSLRKRLRDELEEHEDTDSGHPCSHQSGVGCDDSDNTNKKQKVDNHADTPHQNEVKSHSEDHSNQQQNTKNNTEHDEGDFGDDLGLSASGLRELEMSWSQSESLPEPVARDQVLQMNSCEAEESCPSTSKDSLDDDKDDVPTEVSFESELQHEKHIAYAIAEAKEGAVLACKDTFSVHEAKHDAVPHSEPLPSESLGVNCDDPTNSTIEAVLEPSPSSDSDCKMENTAETTSILKGKVSSTHVLSLHHETIGEDVKANSSIITENIKEVADIPEQVNPNLQDPEVMKETHAAQNHMNSQSSVSANPKDSTKEDSLQESRESQQSRSDSSSQNLTPEDGSQESSKQDQSSVSSSPKGYKRKCLSLRGRRPVPEADAVIEILEDDDSPLPKRSSRLIQQQKKSYKL